MSDYYVTGLNDGCDDYEEPEIESNWSFEFRDGSSITVVEFEDPIFMSETRHTMANEVAEWYFDNCPDNEVLKNYILKNYK